MSKSLTILGCGWLGCRVAEHLTPKMKIVGTARSESSLNKIKTAKATPISLDINSEEVVVDPKILESDSLMIAIPPSGVDDTDFEAFINSIPNDTFKQVILISSTGIYKESNQQMNENSKEIKAEGALYRIERICQIKFKKSLTILRLGGLFGPGRNPVNFLTSKKVLENPRGRINLIHSEDCAKVIERIIEKDVTNKCYNVVMDDHPTKKEFYSTVALLAGKKEPNFDVNGKRYYKVVSNERVKKELDFTFTDIFDAVRSF